MLPKHEKFKPISPPYAQDGTTLLTPYKIGNEEWCHGIDIARKNVDGCLHAWTGRLYADPPQDGREWIEIVW